MSLSRRNPKRDDSEVSIVERLRQLGADVVRLSGAGVPDLLVGWRGLTRVAEVKTGKGRLTDAQSKLMHSWSGAPIPILTTPDEAMSWLLSLRKAADREAQSYNRTVTALNELEDS